MEIEYDQLKNIKNIATRGISFELARIFDFETAVTAEDVRHEYGETRMVSVGYINNRLHVICFTQIDEETLRIISLRKANLRESKIYETQRKTIY